MHIYTWIQVCKSNLYLISDRLEFDYFCVKLNGREQQQIIDIWQSRKWETYARLYLQVVAKKYRGFDIPKEMTAIWKYLNYAYTREEFSNTCPSDKEIEIAYADVAKRLVK